MAEAGAGIYVFQLTVFLEALWLRFFRFYPFRRSLRLSPVKTAAVVVALALAEAILAGQLLPGERQLMFTRFSGLYAAFSVVFILFSFAIIKAPLSRQLFLLAPLAGWQQCVVSCGRLLEQELSATAEGTFFLAGLLACYLVATPVYLGFLRRLAPYLEPQEAEADLVWRWAWVPALFLYLMNTFYSAGSETLAPAVASRVLAFAVMAGYIFMCLLAFERLRALVGGRQKLRLEADMERFLRESRAEFALDAQRTAANRRRLEAWLQGLREGIAARDSEKLESFLQQEESRLAGEALPEHFSEQEILDAVLRYGLGKAKNAGIRTEVKVQRKVHLALADIDICAFLGNLLENAIHGCETLPVTERWLVLHLRQVGTSAALTLDNSCRPDSVHEHEGVFYSEEGERLVPGIGISSIREIVARAGGQLRLVHEAGRFSASVLLPAAR